MGGITISTSYDCGIGQRQRAGSRERSITTQRAIRWDATGISLQQLASGAGGSSLQCASAITIDYAITQKCRRPSAAILDAQCRTLPGTRSERSNSGNVVKVTCCNNTTSDVVAAGS